MAPGSRTSIIGGPGQKTLYCALIKLIFEANEAAFLQNPKETIRKYLTELRSCYKQTTESVKADETMPPEKKRRFLILSQYMAANRGLHELLENHIGKCEFCVFDSSSQLSSSPRIQIEEMVRKINNAWNWKSGISSLQIDDTQKVYEKDDTHDGTEASASQCDEEVETKYRPVPTDEVENGSGKEVQDTTTEASVSHSDGKEKPKYRPIPIKRIEKGSEKVGDDNAEKSDADRSDITRCNPCIVGESEEFNHKGEDNNSNSRRTSTSLLPPASTSNALSDRKKPRLKKRKFMNSTKTCTHKENSNCFQSSTPISPTAPLLKIPRRMSGKNLDSTRTKKGKKNSQEESEDDFPIESRYWFSYLMSELRNVKDPKQLRKIQRRIIGILDTEIDD